MNFLHVLVFLFWSALSGGTLIAILDSAFKVKVNKLILIKPFINIVLNLEQF